MALIMHELCRAAAEEVAEDSTRWFGVFSFGEYRSHFSISQNRFSFLSSLCLPFSLFKPVSVLSHPPSERHIAMEISPCSQICSSSDCLLLSPSPFTYTDICILTFRPSPSLSFFQSLSLLLLFLCRLKTVDQRRNVHRSARAIEK